MQLSDKKIVITIAIFFFSIALTCSTAIAVEPAAIDGEDTHTVTTTADDVDLDSGGTGLPGDWFAEASNPLSGGVGTTTGTGSVPGPNPVGDDGGTGQEASDPNEEYADNVAEIYIDIIEDYLEDNDIDLEADLDKIEDEIEDQIEETLDHIDGNADEMSADDLQEAMEDLLEAIEDLFDDAELPDEIADHIEDRIELGITTEIEEILEDAGWEVTHVDDGSEEPGAWGENVVFEDPDGETYTVEPGETLTVENDTAMDTLREDEE